MLLQFKKSQPIKPYQEPKELAWTEYPDGRLVCNLKTEAGRNRYHALLALMCERQGWRCGLCGNRLFQPTFDHEHPRRMGGGFRDDRIEVAGRWQNAAVCAPCNAAKGSRRIEYLEFARGER